MARTVVSLLALSLLGCGATATAPIAASGPFRYAPDSGRCVDANGNEGFNERSLEEIARTRDGQCVDLSGQDIFEAIEGGGDGKRPAGFAVADFRGANLRDTGFPPYDGPRYGQLQGADIRGTHDVYHMPLHGLIDRFTRYDADRCEVSEQGKTITCQAASSSTP